MADVFGKPKDDIRLGGIVHFASLHEDVFNENGFALKLKLQLVRRFFQPGTSAVHNRCVVQ